VDKWNKVNAEWTWMRAQNRWRKKTKKERKKNEKSPNFACFLDLLSQMRTNMYVIHHHNKREREVEHVTVLKTTTQMRKKKREQKKERDNAQCIWAYDFSVVVRRADQRTLVLASLSKNKYNIERENEKEEGNTYSPVTQCRCREKDEKRKHY